MTVNLLIAGSRSLTEYQQLAPRIDEAVATLGLSDIDLVISGMARGVDTVAAQWAKAHNLQLLEMPAAWHDLSAPGASVQFRYGKPYNRKAGFQRNERMAEKATHAILLIRNRSKGSMHMLSLVQGKIPTVVREL